MRYPEGLPGPAAFRQVLPSPVPSPVPPLQPLQPLSPHAKSVGLGESGVVLGSALHGSPRGGSPPPSRRSFGGASAKPLSLLGRLSPQDASFGPRFARCASHGADGGGAGGASRALSDAVSHQAHESHRCIAEAASATQEKLMLVAEAAAADLGSGRMGELLSLELAALAQRLSALQHPVDGTYPPCRASSARCMSG